MDYSIVLDVYEGSLEVDEAEFERGGIVGIIIRINDIKEKMRMDSNFVKQWTEAKNFLPVPYFVYDTRVTQRENFEFLYANMPKCPAVFIDIEVNPNNLSPWVLGTQFNEFITACKMYWHTIIYTGAGFIDRLDPWRLDVDYWWSYYPKSMYPDQRINVTWEKLHAMCNALPFPPANLLTAPYPVKLHQCSGDRLIVPGSTRAIDVSIFPGTKSDYTKWIGYDTITLPEVDMPNTLQVPFVSQVTPGAQEHNNDCGAASALMILRAYHLDIAETVDQLYNEIQPSGDTALSIGGLQRVLAARRITNEYRVNVQLSDLFTLLVDNRPAIALIHYGALVDAKLTEFTGFRGAHFVVVIGMDVKFVYIHDPYSNIKGNTLQVPIPIFKQAMSQCGLDGNPTNACIFIIPPIGDLSPVQPTGTVYNWGKDPVTGRDVQAVNVRSGPAITYPIAKILYKTSGAITITQIQNGYAQLLDKSGWVYIAYFTKA